MLNSAKRVKRTERRNERRWKKEKKYGGPLNRLKKNRASVLLNLVRAATIHVAYVRTYIRIYVYIIYRESSLR